ncbi:MAG: toll/interleukin-1 receptor domain-containing protein [Planctomycetia bacterium]|nr:toll/interleukin-1 receptor domain-containing protein [Planctomycetia bacterium]
MSNTPPPIPPQPGAHGKQTPPDACDIFVSYRRQGGAELARFLAEKLTIRGYHVFLDVDTLGAGSWSDELQRRVDECSDFIAIVTEDYVERCKDADSVVYHEVARALGTGVNVIPLLVAHQRFAEQLPNNPVIEGLKLNNGVRYYHEYPDPVIDTLCSRLVSTPLLGPERLQTPEAQAKVVVATVGFLLGAWQGSHIGERATFVGVYPALTEGLFWGLVLPIVIGVPFLVLLAIVGHALKIRRDRLYGGPWVPFWALFVPLVFVLSSFVTVGILRPMHVNSFFWGGLLGGLVGIGMTALAIITNAWSIVGRMLGVQAR